MIKKKLVVLFFFSTFLRQTRHVVSCYGASGEDDQLDCFLNASGLIQVIFYNNIILLQQQVYLPVSSIRKVADDRNRARTHIIIEIDDIFCAACKKTSSSSNSSSFRVGHNFVVPQDTPHRRKPVAVPLIVC